MFYGTTVDGGTHSDGTVFGVTPAGKETLRFSFPENRSTTSSISTLIDVNGVLYGTTTYAGTLGLGSIFSITTNGVEKTLYSFGGGNDGRNPEAGLIDLNGVLYGTTPLAGTHGGGTVFAFVPGGRLTTLYDFSGRGTEDGMPSSAALIAVNGILYGTTGGQSSSKTPYYHGTVYSIAPGGIETTLYTLGGDGGADGLFPYGGVTSVNGVLYGTTYIGGSANVGTVYSLQL